MWSVVLLTVAFVAQSWAIPVLPLGVAGIEKLEELKTSDNLRTFIVQVQGTPEPKEEQKQRDYPWAYPPVFEPYLPSEAKQRLNQIYVDSSLSAEQREQQVNAVFDELPQQVVASLPLPGEYERLPADVYKRIFYIHVAPGFSWAERQELTRTIVEALPEEQKQLMRTPRIGGPPSGFEFVLAPTVYKQLLFVHHNTKLRKEEKAEMITRIMRQVPQEQINRLPLPQGMDRLPAELQTRVRSLVYDYSVPQPVRAQRVREFVQQLPEQLRPQLR